MDTGQDTTDKDATDKDTTDKDTKGKDIKGTDDTMDTDKEYKDKFMAAVAQLQQDHEIGRADVVPLVESMKLMPEATARYSELIERIMVLQLAAVRLDNQRDGSQLH
ncbi:hypothetical protein CspeluHIS016_0303340 [Cutaneotrichosporon spelunceum]|uniref:Uncharacterized protein n=1 Tax=Cutaneotrichosporon spelunceum TaxID=1672016 RepID=A0AAD3TTW4_9TREE|nr:hypothetical protein CspeluHIS016_0303340 [Cutaneotrichosporon spelunceum]